MADQQTDPTQQNAVSAPSNGSTATVPVSPTVVKSIDVKGNKAISISAILAKIKTKVGQEYLQSVISDDLKRLYNTGYFSDVRVDRQPMDGGVKVIFYIEEKPVIDKVTFSKIAYFSPKVLIKKIKTQGGKFLDNKSLKDDENTIKELYAKKGLTLVEVEPETSRDEATGKVNVHFIIREGQRVRIRRINIDGNVKYKDKQIIKIIKTRAKTVFNSGYLSEETLQQDMERILSFYEQHGFIDAKADFVVEQRPKGFIDVKVTISEGRQYMVGHIVVSGNNVVPESDILNAMEDIKVKNVFSREKLSVDIARIRSLYFDKGYIFADVRDATSLDPDTGNVDIRLDVTEGSVAYVNKIKVQGNTRTRDIVIRRELRLNPGDRFDGGKLKRSKERLTNLQYFEDVGFDIEDTDQNDRKDLVVQVKEAKTGSFSFGGGFSTVDQVIGFIEVEQRNFDFTNWPTFTGGGQNLKLRAETGSTRNNLLLSFTEPWIFDHPVSGGFDVFRTERTRAQDIGYAYAEKRVGGNIRLGKEFSEYTTGRLSYRREDVTIHDLESNVSADLLAEEGTNAVSSLGSSVTWNSTDSSFNPTKGLIVTGSTDLAGGPLGGDKDFYRFEGSGSYYFPFKFKSVLEFRLRSGLVAAYGDSEKVPIFERFFAGGARTIRGYNERRVGPLDPNTEGPIGGESMVVGNIEYTIPLIDYVKLAGFLDAGNVWARKEDFGSGGFKTGAGFGLRVKTPIGPINLDYGYPLNDEPGEDQRSGKFYFSVSRGF
ncbi:MAG: outer membrane protein assembly factor BamA [Candidatus Omnitrophica bacterium]|nr:outer membrane protein assembly factor BamA [Candidatus Omnitrophota bacterium]